MEHATLRLPDCAARPEGHVLSARQRREIIRALARDGKAGLEKWLMEEQRRDPHIRRRVKEERERLEREARLEKRRIEAQYGEERKAKETDWERRMNEFAAKEAGLRAKLDKAREGPRLTMDDLVLSSDLFRAAAGQDRPRSLWARIKGFFVRIWIAIVTLWIRFVRTLRGMAGKAPDKASRVVTLPDGMQIELGGLRSLSPGMVAQIRHRLKEGKGMRERMKQWWDRMMGREDYAEIATRMMEEELAARAATERLEMDAESADLEERLKRLQREGNEAVRRRRDEFEELEEKRDRDLEELEGRLRQGPYEAARDDILGELAESGLVDSSGDATESLLDRFSGLLLDEARRTLPSGGQTTPGTYLGGDGEYHKSPLSSLNERGAIELVDSVIQARLKHPRIRHLYDQDLVVHREIRSAKTHVVLIFDQSGSMEEKGRLEAAKTVGLVMYRAVKEADPMNRVDLIAMSTGVEHVDLAGLWNAEPKGFTNHGAALREARYLLEAEGADRRLVYLITDGLPEAMTVNGQDTADRPEVCMPYALEQAKELGHLEGVRLFVIQLETKEALYVEAAEAIAKAAGGSMEAVEPDKLTRTLLVDLDDVAAANALPAEVAHST